MNMQMLMQQAKKMQSQLQKDQEELEKREYEGSSSLVTVKMNGRYEVISIKINLPVGEAIESEDRDLLEDMIMVAMKLLKKLLMTKRK